MMMTMLAGGFLAPDNPSTWVAVSFVAFIGLLLYYGVPAFIFKALDDRAEAIKSELDEARRLRNEARDLLADYQRKAAEAETEANLIIEKAQEEAQLLATETHRNLEDMLARRTKLAEEKIARAEQQALGEVQSAAVDAAVAAAGRLLKTNVTPDVGEKLIDDGIKDLRGKLN